MNGNKLHIIDRVSTAIRIDNDNISNVLYTKRCVHFIK